MGIVSRFTDRSPNYYLNKVKDPHTSEEELFKSVTGIMKSMDSGGHMPNREALGALLKNEKCSTRILEQIVEQYVWEAGKVPRGFLGDIARHPQVNAKLLVRIAKLDPIFMQACWQSPKITENFLYSYLDIPRAQSVSNSQFQALFVEPMWTVAGNPEAEERSLALVFNFFCDLAKGGSEIASYISNLGVFTGLAERILQNPHCGQETQAKILELEAVRNIITEKYSQSLLDLLTNGFSWTETEHLWAGLTHKVDLGK